MAIGSIGATCWEGCQHFSMKNSNSDFQHMTVFVTHLYDYYAWADWNTNSNHKVEQFSKWRDSGQRAIHWYGGGGSGFLSSVSSLPERLRAIQANLLMSLPNSGQLKQHLQKMWPIWESLGGHYKWTFWASAVMPECFAVTLTHTHFLWLDNYIVKLELL